MPKTSKATIDVQGTAVTILSQASDDYISLTDIAKHKEPDRSDQVIQNWMRNRNTIEFLGVWERLNNASFKPLEFEGFKTRAGLNSFVLTPRQWIDATHASGLVSKSGRYGGTYAHRDIAFEFAAWISVEFKLYLIKEFQRLKEDESRRLSLAWNLNRTLSKLNYRIHTDAIKAHLMWLESAVRKAPHLATICRLLRRHEAMTILRATAIMKTDISGSTVRFRALPEADLHALLVEHREFLNLHAAAHEGRIVKPEGDGFWLVFPSVTAAALAAMAMQEELRLAQPNKADDRLAMRVVITLGDVLHEEGALIGDAVVLTARIESITPPDEIYLSAAAWLAVNQAEIRAALVDRFPLKGFSDSVPVYRVEQTHRTRVIANQYIVVTDLRNFSGIMETVPMTTVEKILEALFELANRVAREFSGTVRFSVGDSYLLTFADASLTMTAAERLSGCWGAGVLLCAKSVFLVLSTWQCTTGRYTRFDRTCTDRI